MMRSSRLARTVLLVTLFAASAAAFAQSDSLVAIDPPARLVAPNLLVPGGVNVIARSAAGSPIAGAAVTFSAPGGSTTLVFSNGANSITVATDANGRAHADATAAGRDPGWVNVTASMATAPDIRAGSIAIEGPTFLDLSWVRNAVAGDVLDLGVRVEIPWIPCTEAATAAALFADSRYEVTLNGVRVPDTRVLTESACADSRGYELLATALVDNAVPGSYDVNALVILPQDLGLLQVLRTITIAPDAQLTVAGSATPLDFSLIGWHTSAVDGDCAALNVRAARVGDAGLPASAPPGFDLPYGLVRVEGSQCSWNSGVMLPLGPITLRAVLGVPDRVPDGAAMWAYGPTSDDASAHWYLLGGTVSGRFAEFEVSHDGSGGDVRQNSVLNATVALAVPRNGASAGALQDLWWAGMQENGWGLSLTQHRSTLFGALFIYDAAGQPTWLVMPGGSWNAQQTVYTGNLYRPHAPRYDAYDASQFVVGPSVGTLRLTVNSMDSITMDYTIDGVTGRKAIVRQRFGPSTPLVYTRSFADLWWGGVEQNGWGFAIAQQAATLFGVWFTYDSARNPTWFVVPGVDLLSSACCNVPLYRAQSSPWLGQAYDASRFSVSSAGTANFTLGDSTGTIDVTVDKQAIPLKVSRQPF
jgi:hypothetical protein